MTAITHVVNYTVRSETQIDSPTECDWRQHVEINHACEIALNRISKWHSNSGQVVYEVGPLTIRKAQDKNVYFGLLTEKINGSEHALVTMKLLLEQCQCPDVFREISDYLLDDCQSRLNRLK
ncbi:cytoplasmic protein [Shewanella sp. NIFS-20-20]|uniref:cytoplasmic protein n=1 Tax=Shewanella sp. NIFS-20-20 TaxID=2853806 RepID=UPI001C44B853|nr:cytoplasmic protein [Shewanella sp. NIFS-20-20]MBV7315331.1 cytoplasmic protein [Shewanella sp. NIFS-20-20]